MLEDVARRSERMNAQEVEEEEFFKEVDAAARENLQMELRDLRSKKRIPCDICAGSLCNSPFRTDRNRQICNSLRALQRLGPLAHPGFSPAHRHRARAYSAEQLARAIARHYNPQALSGQEEGLVHVRYGQAPSPNPEHRNWQAPMVATFPLGKRLSPQHYFNCTPGYAFYSVKQLRQMLISNKYWHDLARLASTPPPGLPPPGLASPSALAQEEEEAAHPQAQAARSQARAGGGGAAGAGAS